MIVEEQLLLPDGRPELEKEIKRLADQRQISLILTTGGTGFSERDCTPEATKAVCEREVPGDSGSFTLLQPFHHQESYV